MTCGHIRDSGGDGWAERGRVEGWGVMDALSVTHQSSDTDVSDADAEI